MEPSCAKDIPEQCRGAKKWQQAENSSQCKYNQTYANMLHCVIAIFSLVPHDLWSAKLRNRQPHCRIRRILHVCWVEAQEKSQTNFARYSLFHWWPVKLLTACILDRKPAKSQITRTCFKTNTIERITRNSWCIATLSWYFLVAQLVGKIKWRQPGGNTGSICPSFLSLCFWEGPPGQSPTQCKWCSEGSWNQWRTQKPDGNWKRWAEVVPMGWYMEGSSLEHVQPFNRTSITSNDRFFFVWRHRRAFGYSWLCKLNLHVDNIWYVSR